MAKTLCSLVELPRLRPAAKKAASRQIVGMTHAVISPERGRTRNQRRCESGRSGRSATPQPFLVWLQSPWPSNNLSWF